MKRLTVEISDAAYAMLRKEAGTRKAVSKLAGQILDDAVRLFAIGKSAAALLERPRIQKGS